MNQEQMEAIKKANVELMKAFERCWMARPWITPSQAHSLLLLELAYKDWRKTLEQLDEEPTE